MYGSRGSSRSRLRCRVEVVNSFMEVIYDRVEVMNTPQQAVDGTRSWHWYLVDRVDLIDTYFYIRYVTNYLIFFERFCLNMKWKCLFSKRKTLVKRYPRCTSNLLYSVIWVENLKLLSTVVYFIT